MKTLTRNALVATALAAGLTFSLTGCATNPMDAAACTTFIGAQNVYDDAANNALKDNTPVNSGLWTAAWKALPTGVEAASKLANGNALKAAFAAYITVLQSNGNAAESMRLKIWNDGYAQGVLSVCVSTKAAQPGDLTPINLPK